MIKCTVTSTYKNTLCPKETSYIIKQVQSLPFKNRLKSMLDLRRPILIDSKCIKVSGIKYCSSKLLTASRIH